MSVVADTIDEFASDPEMVAMFVNNANELLEQIETDLVAIEKTPVDDRVAVVNRIFRSAHTIKGESGFVGLSTIGKLAHSMENILDQVRESKIEPTNQVVSTLLSSLDVLRALLDNVEASNSADITESLDILHAISDSVSTPLVVSEVSEPTVVEHVETTPQPDATDSTSALMSESASQDKLPTPTIVGRTRVLVVDDEPIVRSLVCRQFNKSNINVEQADSAESAIQIMRKNLYHVVICDLNLPGMSGVELLPKLKAISPLVQVIMLTGDANLVTVLESLENGAIDFIPKTRDYSVLVPPVQDALARVDRWMPLMKSRR